MQRPRHIEKPNSDVYKLMSKNNKVLEEVVTRFDKFAHLLYIDSVNEYMYFGRDGRLTNTGKEKFWTELDKEMKRLDKGLTDLLPRRSSKLATIDNKEASWLHAELFWQ